MLFPRQQHFNILTLLTKPENLKRAINYGRQIGRPKNPKNLNFDIDYSHIPDDFLLDDVKIGNRRHLVFGTQYGLDVLSRSKSRYLDGTFELVKKPFYQLFTIHCFIKDGDDFKQTPCVFILMSGKKKKDYIKVIGSVISKLPAPPAVTKFTTDFEKAIWKALSHYFPSVPIQGCAFHWRKAVFKRVKELGLQTSYRKSSSVNAFVKLGERWDGTRIYWRKDCLGLIGGNIAKVSA